MKHYLPKPKVIQFELSSVCNLLCLGCVRTDPGSFNTAKSFINRNEYLSKETFLKILSSDFFSPVEKLDFCGTIDDPLTHPDFLTMLDMSLTVKQYEVIIHTNASLRTPEYFVKLAKVLGKHRQHTVHFSIDGLEDTNHLYRQGSSWSKIMENAQAFIAAGGHAMWQFLVFPWNKHQIDLARQKSKDMGFRLFQLRHDRSLITKIGLEKVQQRKLINKVSISEPGDFHDFTRSLDVRLAEPVLCNTQKYSQYFIGHDGRIWPCCFIHNGFLATDSAKTSSLKQRLYTVYNDTDWNNVNNHEVDDIIQHRFYAEDLVDSWQSTQHGTAMKDRIFRCTEVCSKTNITELPIGNHEVETLNV
jgi:MoaA/NifB/PqqE/SkfB family radical SAM enzyme